MPKIGVPWVKAKIDTGALSSALHAYGLTEFTRNGVSWVSFSVHPWQHSHLEPHQVELPVADRRVIRSSSGHAEERYMVNIPIKLVGKEITALVSLANRDEMGFRMLIGREALRQGFIVDPSQSYLGSKPPRHVRKKNRAVPDI